MNSTDIRLLLEKRADTAERALDEYLSYDKTGGLSESMKYAVLGGGKRIRAFLAMECAAVAGGCEKDGLAAACAVEMIHAYSLVHDDMPCMDNDDMRRGKPSCHKAFGEAEALLDGDALLTYAFQVCADGGKTPARALGSIRALAEGAGALGMCGGQYIDLIDKPDSWESLVRLHRLKTGALIKAACLSGYYSGTDAPDGGAIEALSEYAMSLGLAFQIVDDVLDVTSTPEELGKPVGSDAANAKVTALTFMSLDEAKIEAKRITEDAVRAVSALKKSEVLCALAEYLLERRK